jgi:hypothetical protein
MKTRATRLAAEKAHSALFFSRLKKSETGKISPN